MPAPARAKKLAIEELSLEERVRRRAQELYRLRGDRPGSAMDDWLQAEEEIQRAEEQSGRQELTPAAKDETTMPSEIRPIDYYYATVPDKSGTATRIFSTLQQAGINLLGVSAFPHGARRSQVDLIPEDSAAFVQAAKSAGLILSRRKRGFLLQGDDRPGAIAEITQKLAQANINITSVQAFCAGSGRYGGMLWVKQTNFRKAAKVLGIG